MSIIYNKTSSDENLESAFPPSNVEYKNKVRILHNLRARIINNDRSLNGLLNFVPSLVVPDNHPMFETVAYTNGDEMYFGDKFFSIPKTFQCAVVLHEMFHIVFRHVSRGKTRIHSLYNIAADAIINEAIGFQNLEGTDSSYACLPKEHVVNLESLYEIYKIPLEEQKLIVNGLLKVYMNFLLKKIKEDLEKKVAEQEKNKGKSKGKSKGKGKGKSSASLKSAGDEPNKDSGNSNESELDKLENEIRDLQRKLAKKHKMFDGSDMENGNLKDGSSNETDDFKWTQRFNRAKSQAIGSKNFILGRINPDVYKPQILWQVELRKYLIKRCMPNTEINWQRPARRMPSLKRSNTYMPGIQNKKGLDKMAVIIDTSGSCFNEEELSMFCTEIQSIQSQTNVELALIFADTDVQSEFIVKSDGTSLLDKMKSGIVKAAGGGGTNMVVPFLYALKKYQPVLTVICSDGYTPFPTKKDVRRTNLLWVLNTNAEIPQGSGKALYIHPN